MYFRHARQVLSSQREPEARAGPNSKLRATPDPKLNIDGRQQVGDLRFSATERSGAAREKHRVSRERLSLCPGLGGGGCFAMYHAKRIITTCSLACSFCDGPSTAQVTPLLLAAPISLTSLVNLDGHKSRLCHLSVIA